MPASDSMFSTIVAQYDKARLLGGGRSHTVHKEGTSDTVSYELRVLLCVGLRISVYVPYPTLSQQNGCEAESFAPLYFPAILVQPPCAIATSCFSAISTSDRVPHLTSPTRSYRHYDRNIRRRLQFQLQVTVQGCLFALAPEFLGYPCHSHASALHPPRAGTLVDVDRG